MRKGQRIETLTKTVGQPSRTGVVVNIRDENFIEVDWDDGHTSVISRDAVLETSTEQTGHKTG
ncbi:MAG: hypothetical protein ACLFWH_06040 [Actinomycetota bacterium]